MALLQNNLITLINTSKIAPNIEIYNCENLNDNIFIQGDIADRPAFGTGKRFYYAQDSKKLYYDTGSEWLEVILNYSEVKLYSHTAGGSSSFTINLSTEGTADGNTYRNIKVFRNGSEVTSGVKVSVAVNSITVDLGIDSDAVVLYTIY